LNLCNVNPLKECRYEIQFYNKFYESGWSDKVFDIIAAIDRGVDALDEIRKRELQ